jgi:ribA/ribD-fused uncharacterized protein
MATCARVGCNRPRNGLHPYCGKTCANMAKQMPPRVIACCSRAGCTRPRYQENGHTFDYCGLKCRDMAKAPAQAKTCARAGCNKPCFQQGTHTFDFCGKTCASASKTSSSQASSTEIKFYYPYQPCFFLTNFEKAPIVLDGEVWDTVEHYYQAQKFGDAKLKSIIRACKTPDEARRIANESKWQHFVRADWKVVNEAVMQKAVTAKFLQHPLLLARLKGTGTHILIEASPTDYFWGCGVNGTGQNKLGQLLMELRRTL